MSIPAQPLSSRMRRTRPRSANANCPGASGRRAGSSGRNGAAARSAVVMNGFSAALAPRDERGARRRRCAARRRFANARTASSKNITPKREMIMSKLAGSKACRCASAQMKLRRRALPLRRGPARRAIIGAEMSMPTQRPVRAEPPRDGERRAARAAADVEHALRAVARDRIDQQVLERLEQPVEHLLRVDPGVSGAAVPKGDLSARSSACCRASMSSPRLAFDEPRLHCATSSRLEVKGMTRPGHRRGGPARPACPPRRCASTRRRA